MRLGYLSDASKLLLFAAAIIITCMIVALGFRAADTAKEINNSAIIQMSQLNNDIQSADISMYDAAEIYGSEVVNFIKRTLGDYTEAETAPISVKVTTTLSQNTYTNKSKIFDIRDFTSSYYIKPTAVFIGEVLQNENKVIIGVAFTQK